jgi:hypothetical protein
VDDGVVGSERRGSGRIVGNSDVKLGAHPNFLLARNPSRIDGKRGDHSYEAGYEEGLGSRPSYFVFRAQPVAQPFLGMSIDSLIGFADRSQTEVVCPSDHHPVEFPYQCL